VILRGWQQRGVHLLHQYGSWAAAAPPEGLVAMYEIRPWLLVGGYAETREPALLAVRGVGAMLQLAEPVLQPGIASLFLAVDDGAPIPAAALRDGMAFVRAARGAGQTVLVACGAGVSRSVAFAAAALTEAEGLGVLNAVRAVRARHPAAQPHYRLLASLFAYSARRRRRRNSFARGRGGSHRRRRIRARWPTRRPRDPRPSPGHAASDSAGADRGTVAGTEHAGPRHAHPCPCCPSR